MSTSAKKRKTTKGAVSLRVSRAGTFQCTLPSLYSSSSSLDVSLERLRRISSPPFLARASFPPPSHFSFLSPNVQTLYADLRVALSVRLPLTLPMRLAALRGLPSPLLLDSISDISKMARTKAGTHNVSSLLCIHVGRVLTLSDRRSSSVLLPFQGEVDFGRVRFVTVLLCFLPTARPLIRCRQARPPRRLARLLRRSSSFFLFFFSSLTFFRPFPILYPSTFIAHVDSDLDTDRKNPPSSK
jgi:hypothetical protein